MKKNWFKVLACLLAIFVLAACGKSSSEASKESSSSSSKEEAVSGASQKTYTDPSELKDSYDVIVIGSGGAGMTAAISAQEAGADVAIFEKMPIIGGNTSKSSGGMNASETKFQKEQGIDDSNDLFYEETLKGGKGTNNPELLRYMVDNSAEAIDWLDSIGITLSDVTFSGGFSKARIHRPADGSAVGGYLVDGLYNNLMEKDIPVFVNADVTEITEKDGQANGVKVTVGKEEKTISAKAVVDAAGGFGANMEMITEYKPELKDYVTTNHEGATGDGIKLAEKLGAATVQMDQIQIHPTVYQEEGKAPFLVSEAIRGEGAILVNAEGNRFYNEMETRDNVSAAINKLPEQYAYVVFDQQLREHSKSIDTYEEQGMTVKADSLADLAKEIGVSADNLEKTVENWNKYVADKNDTEFGRTTGMDRDMSKGPFYAIKIAPGIHHTMGGLKINTNTEVLKEDGSAIPGLYAAGEVTGGVHGSNRIGGNAVADIVIFGRQAGAKAAEFAK
ncbi:flavocytochrome c [Streptococcus hyovaginalis]|uniref:flavocytochrome c n=1 Tax=Streptococcus hyovaginalis TaxID=149015 RepID=UPI002A91A7F2|nr:flavocytochrome c [Streptococcus hyovaginalis]MDY5974955.1 flavocytochrome c [Streptococcus hyovaginalis]